MGVFERVVCVTLLFLGTIGVMLVPQLSSTAVKGDSVDSIIPKCTDTWTVLTFSESVYNALFRVV